MKNALVWFKNDLRLHDNEALAAAIASGKELLPVYIVDPAVYRPLSLGFRKTGAVRFAFLRDCVADLRENLRKIGGDLMVVTGDPVELLPRLVTEFQCGTVYAETEFATEEQRRMHAVEKALPDPTVLKTYWGRTLYHLDDIPYRIDAIPLTSKAYRINTVKHTAVRKALEAPTRIRAVPMPQGRWGRWPDEGTQGLPVAEPGTAPLVRGGETLALERLRYYLFETELLTSYRWTRNRSLGMDYSSKFSPYMALGCLSPRTIYEAVKEYERTVKKNQSTWWLIFEIIWRDYFTFKLMRFQNAVYRTEGYSAKSVPFTNDRELFGRWCSGRTGVPFVDAHMRQLNETGFMSNRGRVNCSSFLAHDYSVDWTWGAAYFESRLIDYDVASNWMNWHAQTYQNWYTNPVHQAFKYKAQEFIRNWVPELRYLDDTKVLIPWEFKAADYPRPHTVFKKWTRAIETIKRSGEVDGS